MTDGVKIAIISSASVLGGVIASQVFELLKRKSEERRWYADYFLPKKYESISNLYAAIQSTHGNVSTARYNVSTEEEYNAIRDDVNNLTLNINKMLDYLL